MLHRLLFRDWLLHRKALLITLGIFTAFEIYLVLRVDHPAFWSVGTCVYAAFLTITPMTRDDKFRTTAWTCTLPVSRADQVRARFAGAWLIALAACATALALAAVLPGSRVAPADVLDPQALLLAAGIVSSILVLLIPFTVRFGLMGVLVFLVALQVLGGLLLFVGATMGGIVGIEKSVATGVRAIGAAIVGAREALSEIPFVLCSLVALAALNWAGYRLALALFNRREF